MVYGMKASIRWRASYKGVTGADYPFLELLVLCEVIHIKKVARKIKGNWERTLLIDLPVLCFPVYKTWEELTFIATTDGMSVRFKVHDSPKLEGENAKIGKTHHILEKKKVLSKSQQSRINECFAFGPARLGTKSRKFHNVKRTTHYQSHNAKRTPYPGHITNKEPIPVNVFVSFRGER